MGNIITQDFTLQTNSSELQPEQRNLSKTLSGNSQWTAPPGPLITLTLTVLLNGFMVYPLNANKEYDFFSGLFY